MLLLSLDDVYCELFSSGSIRCVCDDVSAVIQPRHLSCWKHERRPDSSSDDVFASHRPLGRFGSRAGVVLSVTMMRPHVSETMSLYSPVSVLLVRKEKWTGALPVLWAEL